MEYLNYGSIELAEVEIRQIASQLNSVSDDVSVMEDLNLLYDKVIVQFKNQDEFARALVNNYGPVLGWYDALKMQCVIYSLLYNPEDKDDSFSSICEFFEQYNCDVFQYLIKNP